MTRKDYILLAAALRDTNPGLKGPIDACHQWNRDVEAITSALASDNGAFDRDRFYRACGYGD